MHRPKNAALLACLLAIVGAASLAQGSAGRVEWVEQSFAVTIPEDWVGMDPSGDLEERLALIEGWLESEQRPAASAVAKVTLHNVHVQGLSKHKSIRPTPT